MRVRAPRDQPPGALVAVVERDLGEGLQPGDRAGAERLLGDQQTPQEGVQRADDPPGDPFHESPSVAVLVL